ncbi:MAG TPA: OmpA family protein [Polyangia bacterium]|nr:OmpA family protein [Polyangia bacterium]
MNVDLCRGAAALAASLIFGTVLGCHRGETEARQLAAASASYDGLKPTVARLQGALADLQKGADEIAAEVPGGGEFRAKLMAAEEVIGVADARMKWLGGELAGAAASGKKKEEIAALADQVTKAAADLGQVDAVAVELMHEKAHLARIAALHKAPYERVLSTGYRIKAATTGLEARLIGFIQEHKKADPGAWFDFDRLVFVGSGTDVDLPQSRSQLENVVEILKAYPTVKLKIGGYTDSEGPAARREKLSASRAQAVRTALVQMGVPPDRLQAAGYGSARPACPANDTDDCRAQNRRIAVQVTAVSG